MDCRRYDVPVPLTFLGHVAFSVVVAAAAAALAAASSVAVSSPVAATPAPVTLHDDVGVSTNSSTHEVTRIHLPGSSTFSEAHSRSGGQNSKKAGACPKDAGSVFAQLLAAESSAEARVSQCAL